MSDPVKRAIIKFKHHTSLLLVQSKISNRYKFSFSAVNKTNVVEKEIKNINPKKNCYQKQYPFKYIKTAIKPRLIFLEKLVNDAIISGKVSRRSEIRSITPVLKEKP